MTSTALHSSVYDVAPPEAQPADDDVFGIARYLADAVVHGDISEEEGADALTEWAPDRDVLERAATRLPPDSEAEHLLRAASRYAA